MQGKSQDARRTSSPAEGGCVTGGGDGDGAHKSALLFLFGAMVF
jgi:hypothetical protein